MINLVIGLIIGGLIGMVLMALVKGGDVDDE